MIITRLKARLTPEQATRLKASYALTKGPFPPGFIESFLVEGQDDPSDWRILTVWESQEAVDAMRASGQTPRGVQIFREAGVEPELKILNVANHLPQ
ncbi:MAG: antibiotic biosynthesis monooxygenase [Candidatus Kerfeldbacteria bacterium]|nr:antibiotic biosynthesis monooxygenase [Candidatus Kerfeldbacteria bacterium]